MIGALLPTCAWHESVDGDLRSIGVVLDHAALVQRRELNVRLTIEAHRRRREVGIARMVATQRAHREANERSRRERTGA